MEADVILDSNTSICHTKCVKLKYTKIENLFEFFKKFKQQKFNSREKQNLFVFFNETQ